MLEHNVDVSKYIRSKFNCPQTSQIRVGLENDINISVNEKEYIINISKKQ